MTRKRLLADDPELAYWGLSVSAAELEPFESIAQCIRHLHERYAEARGKSVWGQKTPKLVRHVDVLSRAFPGARFVHTVRDPRAVARSLRTSAAHRLHVGYGAGRWVADTRLGLAMETQLRDRCMRVTYEDLVADPERTLRALCSFLGLAWEPRVLDGDASLTLTPQERAFGHHRHVHGAPNPAFADKWREQLSDDARRYVEYLAAETMQELGYAPDEPPRPPSAWMRLSARATHARTVIGRAVHDLTRRPDVWKIARRSWTLGSLRGLILEHAAGR